MLGKEKLTITCLGDELGCPSDGLCEDAHDSFPHTRDDPSGFVPS